MDLFTSLALRSLGMARDVAPLRPALFAADVRPVATNGATDGAEEPASPPPTHRRVEAEPVRPVISHQPRTQLTSPLEVNQVVVERSDHSGRLNEDTGLPRQPATQPTDLASPRETQSAAPDAPLEARPSAAAGHPTSVRAEAKLVFREREIAGREIPVNPPPIEPTATIERQTVRETTHEVVREIQVRETPGEQQSPPPRNVPEREPVRDTPARESSPPALLAPVRPPHPALLIPTAASPRPAALSGPTIPAPQQAPVIQVTIGRVDVSAVPAAPSPRLRAPEARPAVSLNDYLRDPKARPQ